jgi:hypothetical protein
MVSSTTIRDLQDLRVLSFTFPHNRRYIILVIRLCSPLTYLFTCLQWGVTIKETYRSALFVSHISCRRSRSYLFRQIPHGLGYGIRSPPSPHQYPGSPHMFAGHIEYGTPHPGIHPGTPGAIYGSLGPHAMPFYNHGVQFPRHRDGDTVTLRSPILEEFRTNRSRKWELCVRVSIVTCPLELNLITVLHHRIYTVILWSSAATSMVHDLFNKRLKQLRARRNK